MDNPQSPTRTASFDPEFKKLTLWLSPNFFGVRPCVNLAEARKLIAQTGVPQTLVKEIGE